MDTLTDEVVENLLAQQGDKLGEKERAFLKKVVEFYEQFTQTQGDSPEAARLTGLGPFSRGGYTRQT